MVVTTLRRTLHTESGYIHKIKLKQGKITILCSYNVPIKIKMEESDGFEHISIKSFADLELEMWDF